MTTSNMLSTSTPQDKTVGHFLYAMMSAIPLFLIPVLVSFWLNLIQKNIQPNSLLASHLRWQRLSIIGLCPFFIAGYCFSPLWLSITMYLVGISWFSYRIFKGWVSLNGNWRIWPSGFCSPTSIAPLPNSWKSGALNAKALCAMQWNGCAMP